MNPAIIQEPDVELPMRHLLQKKKFVPVDLQAYEKTDFQTQENVGKTEKNAEKFTKACDKLPSASNLLTINANP
uniref:Uncharacterized protein n=1 Tax=Strigamia maritima TaxID=126957 RepID=T1JNZ7_STRMM